MRDLANSLDGRGSVQDTSGHNGSLNAAVLFSAVSVYWRRVITPDDIISWPLEATAARTGGPAVVLLPKNVQRGSCPR